MGLRAGSKPKRASLKGIEDPLRIPCAKPTGLNMRDEPNPNVRRGQGRRLEIRRPSKVSLRYGQESLPPSMHQCRKHRLASKAHHGDHSAEPSNVTHSNNFERPRQPLSTAHCRKPRRLPPTGIAPAAVTAQRTRQALCALLFEIRVENPNDA